MASDRCELLCLDLEVAEQLRLHRLTLRDAERAAGQARALADPTRLMLAAALGTRLRGKDSNLDYLIQSQASYH